MVCGGGGGGGGGGMCVSPEGDHPDINTGDNGATTATGRRQLDPS